MKRGYLPMAALAVLALLAARASPAADAPLEMRWIPEGLYVPFYPLAGEEPTPVAAFLLDALPVTNAEWQAFIDAGGYDDPTWWSPRGWAHRVEAGLERPLFWSADGSRRRFGLVEEIPPDEPVHTLVPKGSPKVTTKVSVFLQVEGAAMYLPAYAGNLDIMTSAALRVAESIAARSAISTKQEVTA